MILLFLMKVVDVVFTIEKETARTNVKGHSLRSSSRIRNTAKKEQCSLPQDTSTTGLVCRQGFGTPCILNVVAFVVVVCVYRRESYLVDTDGGNIVRPSGTRIPET